MKGSSLLIPVLAILAFPCLSFGASPIGAKAEGGNRVYIEAQSELVEGRNYYAYVKLDVSEELSALALNVYFDADVISVSSVYNVISTDVYDSKIHDDRLSMTYIFSDFATGNGQTLFYFRFNIASPVEEGEYCFDVTIDEAYGSSLDNVDVRSTRWSFIVSGEPIKKSTRATPSTSHITTSYHQDFNFGYTLNNAVPCAGQFVLRYDDTLLELVSFNAGPFFENMVFDCNLETVGEICLSFAGASAATSRSLFSITMRPIANTTTTSSISLKAQQLFDSDLNEVDFSANSISVDLVYDSAYEVYPKMGTSLTLDTKTNQIVLDICLEEGSHLGAGDFVLGFDKDAVEYVSYEKRFSPTFFTVNDKKATLEQGQIKFSILSLSDIVNATDVITFVFTYSDYRDDRVIEFELTGNGLTDSLTSPIHLDVSGAEAYLPGNDLILKWANEYLFMDDPSFRGSGIGKCRSDGLYESAKQALINLPLEEIEAFRNNEGNRYTDELARYLAWANANHDASPFTEGGVSEAFRNGLLFDAGLSLPFLVLAVTVGAATLAVLALARKRSGRRRA